MLTRGQRTREGPSAQARYVTARGAGDLAQAQLWRACRRLFPPGEAGAAFPVASWPGMRSQGSESTS